MERKETERELAAVGCLLSEATLQILCIDHELTIDDMTYIECQPERRLPSFLFSLDARRGSTSTLSSRYPSLAEAVEDKTDLHKLWSALAQIKNNRNKSG